MAEADAIDERMARGKRKSSAEACGVFSAVREGLEGEKTTGLRPLPTRAEDSPSAPGVLSRVFVFLWDEIA
jgi:hypothetical protein